MNFDLKITFPARVSIIGAARSGLAAAEFFKNKGTAVFISDTCQADKLEKILSDKGLEHLSHESDAHSDKVLDCDVIILSPGVPSDLEILKKARLKGIAVWSEMELRIQGE